MTENLQSATVNVLHKCADSDHSMIISAINKIKTNKLDKSSLGISRIEVIQMNEHLLFNGNIEEVVY